MKFSRIALAALLAATCSMSAFAAGEHCSTKHVKDHQAKLHDALKLSPEQEPAWTKFTATIKAPPCHDQKGMEELDKLTMPERAARMVKFNEDMHEGLVKHAAAVKDLYEALTPEQKKTMDGFHKKGCCDNKKRAEPPCHGAHESANDHFPEHFRE